MANFVTSRPAPFGAIFALRVVSIAENLILSIKDRIAQRQTVKILSSLTDRELDDIGLTRGDVHRLMD